MLNDTAYIMTKDLNAIMFPNRNDGITPKLKKFPEPRETYMNKLFERKPTFFSSKFSEADDLSNVYTKLEVRAIMHDENMRCVFLIYDSFTDSVCIPGGPISRDVLCSVPYVGAESIFLVSLLGNILMQLYPTSGNTMYENLTDDMVGTTRHKLNQVLRSRFTKIKEKPEIYFSYILPDESQRTFVVYYVYEIDLGFHLQEGRFLPKNIIPLDKELFRISSRCKTRKEIGSMCNLDDISRGVVYDSYGRAQLQAIFNTPELF